MSGDTHVGSAIRADMTDGPEQEFFLGIRDDSNLFVTIPGYKIELTAGDDYGVGSAGHQQM